jgi:hypothetical protein
LREDLQFVIDGGVRLAQSAPQVDVLLDGCPGDRDGRPVAEMVADGPEWVSTFG